MGTYILPLARRRGSRSLSKVAILAVSLLLLLALLTASAFAAGEGVLGPNSSWSTKGTNGQWYSVGYEGGCDACYLNAYITWKGSKGDLGLRVRAPSGEVREFNTRRESQKLEFAYWAPFLEPGTWSFQAFGSEGTHITLTVGAYDGS